MNSTHFIYSMIYIHSFNSNHFINSMNPIISLIAFFSIHSFISILHSINFEYMNINFIISLNSVNFI